MWVRGLSHRRAFRKAHRPNQTAAATLPPAPCTRTATTRHDPGVMDDDLSVTPSKGEYHFYNVDQVYDNMLKHGVKPIVEL